MKIHFALLSGLALGSLVFVACSGSTDEPAGGQGGQLPTSGGAPGSGGKPSSGGATNASGGSSNGSGGSGQGGASAGGAPGSGGATQSNNGGRASQGGSSNNSGGASSGGKASTGGAPGNGGSSNGGANSGGKAATGGSSSGGGASTGDKFSFFVTSIGAMRELSGNQNGFGGDLRFGEADGLAGADKICKTIAEKAMPGAGSKTWRAFLSTVKGPVHAIDRIGNGPWYDRLGRVVALTKADLMYDRPKGADSAIVNDLPNENGIPNHTDGAPGCASNNSCPDNHDVLTGTGPDGKLHSTIESTTCSDWTSSAGTAPPTGGGGASGGGSGGRGGFPMIGGNGPWCGHSWPRKGSGENWMSALAEGGCAPGVNLKETGGPEPGVYTVGTGGGYGAIYCFALTP